MIKIAICDDSEQMLEMIYSKKKEYYNPEQVFGNVRKEQLKAA